jgi:hypothetical protein
MARIPKRKFFQSKDNYYVANKTFPHVPVTSLPTFVLKKVPSVGKTYRTGWPRGIAGRTFIVERSLLYGKRRRGKPPGPARMRGDLIAAYVRQRQQDKPRRKLDMDIVKETAAFFKVDPKTVWNALKVADRRGRTIYAQWYVAYLLSVRGPFTLTTPPPMTPVTLPSPADFPNDPHAALLSGQPSYSKCGDR